MANEYSRTWFDTFLAAIPDATTALEVRGLARRLPLPAYRAVLDVCCWWDAARPPDPAVPRFQLICERGA